MGGGAKNVIHCVHAQNTGACSVFASLYSILHKDVEQEDLSQVSMPFATMPKTLVFAAFYAQNTGIYSVFGSLHNLLHKDVERENRVTSVFPCTKTSQTCCPKK